ncbi:MAG: DNA polymerase III subunit delta [Candidatus Yanofskybacteria bacterium]|nr:DNA polymerase III subunit delta [Candidatus Yanofskybacteria bacterium]
MIIFLYGSDAYRLKENVDTIAGAYNKKHKSGMSHYRFDLENGSDLDRLENAVKSVSFFDEAKLVVVKNSFSVGGDFLNKLSSLTSGLEVATDKKTVLVFVENRTEKELQKTDKDLFAFLAAKPNLVRTINYLGGTKLSNWVRGKFKENSQSISPPVAGLLIDTVGNESWALVNEISKLSNYKKGGTVTDKDVNLLVSQKEDDSIFELTDAVGNQNKAKAFEMMYRFTNSGHDPHYLLSMLVYHFENLLSVSDGSIPKHLHPFVARKAVSQAKKFKKEELVAKFGQLADLDIASKNGQVNLEDALYNFVIV